MAVDEDLSLVEQSLRGDQIAFGRLVDKYQRLVFNLALNMSKNHDDAADITQSVFLKVFEKLQSFDPKYKFFSWLYRIAVNESLNFVQKRGRTEELEEETVSDLPSPDGVMESGDITQGVQDALLELDLNYRVVLILKHFQELSYEEISQVLDIPEKLVKSRLFTARTMLRTVCKQRGIAQG